MLRLSVIDRKTHYTLWALTESIDPANLQKTHDRNFDFALTRSLSTEGSQPNRQPPRREAVPFPRPSARQFNALLFRGSELQLRHELRRAKRTPRAERSEVPCARSLAMLAAGLAFRFVVLL